MLMVDFALFADEVVNHMFVVLFDMSVWLCGNIGVCCKKKDNNITLIAVMSFI